MEQTEDFKEKKTATTNLKCNIVPLSGFDNPAFVKEQETTEANANSDQCAFYEKIDYNDTKATVVLTGNDNSVSSVLKLVGNGEVSVHFESDFEIYGNEGEQAAPTQFVLPRKSLTTSLSSGVPTLINLEHFLQDDDDLNDTPPVTHGRPSIVAIESPLEDFPMYSITSYITNLCDSVVASVSDYGNFQTIFNLACFRIALQELAGNLADSWKVSRSIWSPLFAYFWLQER